MYRLKRILGNIKQWVIHVVTELFNKDNKPKLPPKTHEVTCPCGNKYLENYEPSRGYIPCCNYCLPF